MHCWKFYIKTFFFFVCVFQFVISLGISSRSRSLSCVDMELIVCVSKRLQTGFKMLSCSSSKLFDVNNTDIIILGLM
jgi:hypothetical protein